MNKQLPKHLQELFEKRDTIFADCGVDKDPAEILIEIKLKAEKSGDDNALIHAVM